MTKEMKELRELNDNQLISKSEELRKNLLMCSPNLMDPRMKPQIRGKIRRSIARINTLLGERKRRGVVKQEKRL